MPFIIGRKMEMTQLFQDNGTVVPVTLVQALPNVVTAVREGMEGIKVQMGADPTRSALLSKSQLGHLKELPALKTLREFFVEKTDLKRGDQVTVNTFVPGTRVTVTGTSKGRGFAGVMKRHHFAGAPGSHGDKDQHRMPGSIASQRQGPVTPGQRMAGRMGSQQVTVKNLEVVHINTQENTLAIKGAIPGSRGGLILIVTNDQSTIWQK